jgi:hypothetical protein
VKGAGARELSLSASSSSPRVPQRSASPFTASPAHSAYKHGAPAGTAKPGSDWAAVGRKPVPASSKARAPIAAVTDRNDFQPQQAATMDDGDLKEF